MLSSFGQASVRVSPLQIAMVSAGIANGGKVMQPSLVDSITTSDLKTVESFTPKQYSDPLSSSEAGDLTEAMQSVVSGGTGTNAKIDGVDVAGKTGTAEGGTGDPTHSGSPASHRRRIRRSQWRSSSATAAGSGSPESATRSRPRSRRKSMEAVLNK